MLASSNTMKGALPPSSKLTRLIVLADCCIRSCPTRVDPVNESLRTDGFDVNSAPIACGIPVTTETTPFGKPARSARTANARAENGVSSEGLAMIGQPAAKAGPALRVIIAFRKFHGVIAAETPTGSFQTRILRSGLGAGMVSP